MSITAQRVVFPEIKRAEWERRRPSRITRSSPPKLRVRTARTLVSAGTEIAIYSGTPHRLLHPGLALPPPALPSRLRHAVRSRPPASDVTAFKPRRPRRSAAGHTRTGSWSRPTASGLDHIPDGVTFEQACLARLSAISLQGVRLARLSMGERVAVFGQGLIGQLARQCAALDGAASADRRRPHRRPPRCRPPRRHPHRQPNARRPRPPVLPRSPDGQGSTS